MEKSLKILITAALVLVLALGVICVSVFANSETQAPNLQITACTLSFDDSVYIMYALPIESAAGAEVKMLYFTEPQDTLGDYNYANAKYRESHIDVQNARGKDSYVYKNTHMNAKNMTDVIYARAYAKVGDTEYYSNLVKYSILEYAYNMLGYTSSYTPTARLEKLLKTMLTYGAASQDYFGYKTDRLATDEYYKVSVAGGRFADCSVKGFYKNGETLTLMATPGEENTVVKWYDSLGALRGEGETLDVTVEGKNETYTAQREVAVHICDWKVESEVQKQSCLDDGIVNYVCECGGSKTEIHKATGHSFSDWETVSEPSCSDKGEQVRSCSVCLVDEVVYTDRLTHVYSKSEAEGDGETVVIFSCDNCGDSFTLSEEVAVRIEDSEEQRLTGCPEDFSFEIFCSEDEDYIRDNLKILDTYYEEEGTEGGVDYVLSDMGDGVWLVSPRESYSAGATYKAVRSGGVVLADTGIFNLLFTVFKEETCVVEIGDGIIFLAELDEKNPGYYPYSLEYSEKSGKYLLTVGRIDGLEVGDVICVGDARNADEVMLSSGTNSFGRIELITYSEPDEVYYLILCSPDLNEIFDKLDIYSTHPEQNGDIKFTDEEELEAQVVSALYSSRDFVNFMGAGYVTATELLESRGADTNIGSFKQFLNSIKINREESQEPELDPETGIITAKVVIDGEVSIPVTVTSYGTSRNVGNIVISFTAYVYLDYAKLEVNIESDGSRGSNTKYKFGVSQSVTVGFTFDVAIDVDYSLEAYPYVINRRSNCYHFASCIHVASMNEANAEYVTATELLRRLNEGIITDDDECGTCRPVSAMESDNYVLNRTTKKIHLVDCKHLQTVTESELLISGAAYGNLELSGYTACESCKPYSRYTNSFSEALMRKMEEGDFGHNVEEIKEASDAAGAEEAKKRLLIAEMPLSFGALRADVELYAFVNFTLEASVSYKFERTDIYGFGVELKGKRFVPYEYTESSTNEHSLQVLGETRLEVGAAFVFRAYVLGLEKWMYASFNVEVGAYALANGAVRLDWVSMNDSYFAAYFESGFILNVFFEGKVPLVKTYTHIFYEGDYPFIKLGYQKVAHKFTELPEYILLEDTYLSLEREDLMSVGYYDVVNKTTGTTVLNYLGVEGRYRVEYSFEDGENCFVENGVLYVIDPSKSFADVLKIRVLGEDVWNDFRAENTRFTLPEAEIPIVYEAKENMLSYDVSGGYEYYYLIGIGNYSLGELIIPETYNGKPVLGIDRHAFSSCKSITSVVIPDSIEYIDDHAFYYCENIESIVIGGGVEVLSQGVFNGCTSAAYISIGEGVKVIGDGAFSGCEYVEYVVIPDSVVEIGGSAFGDCLSLKTVVVGKSVETIGRHAFTNCRELTDLYLPKSLIGVGDNVLYYCEKLANIYYEGSESDILNIANDESNLEYISKAVIYYNYIY